MNPFLLKLRHGARLTAEDEAKLFGLARTVRRIDARGDVLVEGGPSRALSIVLEGWACSYKQLEDGRRQITSLLLPGDLCEPFGILPRFMDRSLGAITPVTFAQVAPETIRAAARSNPRIEEALWWDLLVSMAIEREHMVRLGRCTAPESLGHLFCELQARLAFVVDLDSGGFDVPLTQNDLADLLGLTSVHVNRSLRQLRTIGLISFQGRRLIIHDLDRLRDFSFFDSTYLYPDGIEDGRTLDRSAG